MTFNLVNARNELRVDTPSQPNEKGEFSFAFAGESPIILDYTEAWKLTENLIRGLSRSSGNTIPDVTDALARFAALPERPR